MKGLEIEAKIPAADLSAVEMRLKQAGAVHVMLCSFERNWRFDAEDGRLTAAHQVLRLRSCGGKTILTWKGPGGNSTNLARREEIETELADFDSALEILSHLGYRIKFYYEKYRSEYRWAGTEIMLDHTPIGDFVEIEGENEEQIRRTAVFLGLDYVRSVSHSYQKLFSDWKKSHVFSGEFMSFS